MSDQPLEQPDLRTPFEKFEDLARLAFNTPKSVVDQRMAEEKEKRRQARETKKQTPAKGNHHG